MNNKRFPNNTIILFGILGLIAWLLTACGQNANVTPTPSPSNDFVFGVIMVGPHNDRGWSEAHYNAGRYVEAKISNSRMVSLDNLNPNDRPQTTLLDAVKNMVDQGAQLIFITSDDFSAETYLAAQKFSAVKFVHVSGDHVLVGQAPPNLSNYMGKMIYGKMIAGCAAALATKTGSIGYLGPLINDETRRLVDSAYLGARYCYEHYRNLNPDDLRFQVEWIGFWFNIPGVTSDPTQVANNLFDSGVDVLLSGIDTNEALTIAAQRTQNGHPVFAIPYDYANACDQAPNECLGVPYFNWGPGYLKLARSVLNNSWAQSWECVCPCWTNINNEDTSAIGFKKGAGLTAAQAAQLDQFIAGLVDQSIVLFKGPLNFQDGTQFLAADERAVDEQIWYMPQLLAGMEGLSE